MVCEEVVELYCTHEEADTRMFFHLTHVQSPSNVVIRTTDTDCLIIELGNKHFYNSEIKIWLEVGVQSNNTQRFIDVNGLHRKLGEKYCKCLLAYHALTGCDYSASFCRKGKVKPLKILEKNEDLQKTLATFAFSEVDTNTLTLVESYVCRIYGKKTLTEINDVRMQIFLEKYRPKNENERLSYANKRDGSMLPPCQRVLQQKLRRVEMISKRWASSTSAHPPPEVPEESGWILKDGTYEILWYEGDSSPSILDVCCDNDDEEEMCSEDEDNATESSSDEDDEDDKLSYMFISCIFFFTVFAYGIECSRVLELSDRFLEFKNEHDGPWMIKFYAPWCHHCKKLEPIWAQVAQSLFGTNVKVARVDCTRFTSIATHYSISGFPTILFIEKDVVFPYNGDKTREDIIDFTYKMTGPAVRDIANAEKMDEVKRKYELFFLLISSDLNSEIEIAYEKAAKEFRHVNYFFTINHSIADEALGTDIPSAPAIMIFKDSVYFSFSPGKILLYYGSCSSIREK
ncbi:Protein disulfide-isomerase TMX3 [Nymphon striatum]|nr:Protein disulfide-isomerase TMX3 [Nymphon striatum]